MKRGAIVISQEFLKELMKGRMPEDFKLSGVEFVPDSNLIKFHGYSEDFHETIECAMHMNEANDGWTPRPRRKPFSEYKEIDSLVNADNYEPASREPVKVK